MACFNGKHGAIKIGADGAETNIAQVTSWTITENVDTVECTSMNDTARSYMSSIPGWEGSADVVWDATTAGLTLGDGGGTPINLVAYADNSDQSGTNWEGNIVITSIETSAEMDDVIRASISFTGTGALTYTA